MLFATTVYRSEKKSGCSLAVEHRVVAPEGVGSTPISHLEVISMTDDERDIFNEIVEQCKLQIKENRYKGINVAGKERREALVAAYNDLERYRKALEQIASKNHPSLNRGIAIKALEEI